MTSSESLKEAAQAPPRVVRITYGELASGDAATRTGLDAPELVSLHAHPYARSEDLAAVVLEGTTGVVGRLVVIPGRVRIADSVWPISWGSGWFARPEVRGSGALLLLQALQNSESFGVCLFPADVRRIYEAARLRIVRMPRYVLLMRSRPYWKQVLPLRLAGLAAWPTDLGLTVLRKVGHARAHGRSQGFVVEEVNAFDERVGDVDRARTERFHFVRDHRELNWVLANPWLHGGGFRFRSFYVRQSGSDEVLGYALARIRSYGSSKVASLLRTAVRAGHERALRAMVEQILDAVCTVDVNLVDVAGTDPVLRSCARELGMIPHGHIDLGCRFGIKAARALAQAGADLSHFRLDMAEGDVIFL